MKVTLGLDGWPNVHNEQNVTITTKDGDTFLTDTIVISGTAQRVSF